MMTNTTLEVLYYFLDNRENFIDKDEVTDVANDTFSDTYKCVCTYKGSEDYFSRTMGQWYPGDPPEYEVDGYEDYIETMVKYILDIFTVAFTFGEQEREEVIHFIKSNLNDFTYDLLLDIEDYEDKAIENYRDNSYYPDYDY